MKKPKIRVLLVYKDGVSSFVPEVEGLNPGGMCSAYEAMMDALIMVERKLPLAMSDNERNEVRDALKKAGVKSSNLEG
jgi:hypothetical protein